MPSWNAIDWCGKTVNRLTATCPDPERRGFWVCLCSCGNRKSVSSMALKGGQKSCGCVKNERPANWVDRTGTRHRKLFFLAHLGGVRWKCRCDCGNETVVLTTNLSKTTGCRACANRLDITGERVGLLVAQSVEGGKFRGRNPVWTFRCDCGNTIPGTVREFRANWLRSCGCTANVHSSWTSMMARCYDENCRGYEHWGGRGIKVCPRWHEFENFVADMGERPKRYTLGRKNAEGDYEPGNCVWEHVSLNTADTYYGKPTKVGLVKGARPRPDKLKK